MLLALDIGNTQIFAGVFNQHELKLTFRKSSKFYFSSDEYGIFLKQVLHENQLDPKQIKHIIFSSVVPEINHSLSSACIKYFNVRPLILQAGLKTGLKINYQNPLEVGADRIANAIAANHLYRHDHKMVFDFGTATTCDIISSKNEYLGGLIAPGIKMGMETLERDTAKLPTVEITQPNNIIGRSTVSCIQSGLYYGALGFIKHVTQEIANHYFKNEPIKTIGTGGFINLFKDETVFDHIDQSLVLKGLALVHYMNP